MAFSPPAFSNDTGDKVSGTLLDAAFFTALFDAISVNWAPDSYSPSWTGSGSNPAIGNGTITGQYINIGGKLVVFSVKITIGSTTTFGSGIYSISLPLSANTGFPGLINVFAQDASASGAVVGLGNGFISTSTTFLLYTTDVTSGSAYPANSTYTPSIPITFANGDVIHASGVYFRP